MGVFVAVTFDIFLKQALWELSSVVGTWLHVNMNNIWTDTIYSIPAYQMFQNVHITLIFCLRKNVTNIMCGLLLS